MASSKFQEIVGKIIYRPSSRQAIDLSLGGLEHFGSVFEAAVAG